MIIPLYQISGMKPFHEFQSLRDNVRGDDKTPQMNNPFFPYSRPTFCFDEMGHLKLMYLHLEVIELFNNIIPNFT